MKGVVYIFHDLFAPANKTAQKRNYIYTSRFNAGTCITGIDDSLAVCAQILVSTGESLKDVSWAEALLPFNELQFLSMEVTKGILLVNPSFQSLMSTQVNVCCVFRAQYEISTSGTNAESNCCPYDYGLGFSCQKSLNNEGICERGHSEALRDTFAHQVSRSLKIGTESRVTVTIADGEFFLGTDRVETDVFIALHAKLAAKDEVTRRVTAVKASLKMANLLNHGAFLM